MTFGSCALSKIQCHIEYIKQCGEYPLKELLLTLFSFKFFLPERNRFSNLSNLPVFHLSRASKNRFCYPTFINLLV